MKNIPFPNPHDADALNDYLDALAAGEHVSPEDEVQAAAADVQALANRHMPSIPEQITGVHTGGETMQTAAYSPPISNRTRRERAAKPKRSRLEPWLSGLLVAGLLVSMIGYTWWNGPGGGDENNNLAWAPGTAEPFEQQAELLNPETAPWMADFQYQDCQKVSDIEQVEVNYGDDHQTGPQGYAVVGPASFSDGLQVSNQYRAMRGCSNLRMAWAYWSEARINEHPRVLNENNQTELAEMEAYFGTVYPEQFMATAEGLQVSPEVRQEWESRIQQGIVGQPIPMGARLNPAWAVELSDGRVAIPATFMYSVDDPAITENGLPTEYPPSTVVIVFTMEENEWKYDDSLQLCITNCESGMGSPLDDELNTWAVPGGIEQCPDEMGLGISGLEPPSISPDRSFTTVGTPTAADLNAISPDRFTELGCGGSSEPIYTMGGATSMMELNQPGSQPSEALAPYFMQSERGGAQIVVENPQFSQMEVVKAEPYSLQSTGPDGLPMQPVIFMNGDMENLARTKYHFSQIDMNRAVLLEDGRMALTTTVLLSNQDRGAIYYEGDPELFPMPIIILKDVAGQWLIDEAISVPRYVGLVTPSYSWWWDSRYLSTPTSSPAATQVAENEQFVWAAPISPKECPDDETVPNYDPDNPASTLYTQEDYDQVSADRSYEIVGPAEPETAYAVVTRVRQSDACRVSGKNLPWVSTRYEYENRTSAGRESLEATVGQRSDGSSTISGWYEDDLGLTPTDMYVNQDPDAVELQGDESLEPTVAFNPDQAVEFADGRIGIIPSGVSYDGESGTSADSVPVYILILVNQDGEWMLDEKLRICIGECPAPMATP